MLPSGGQAGAVQPKLKRSREHQLEHNLFKKQRRKCSREAREVEEAERSLANESKRMQKRTTFACDFAYAGCRQRPFLSKSGAVAHSRSCMYSGLGDRRPDECRVKLRVRVSSRVQVSLRAQRSGVKVQLRSAFAHTTSILKVERPAATSKALWQAATQCPGSSSNPGGAEQRGSHRSLAACMCVADSGDARQSAT